MENPAESPMPALTKKNTGLAVARTATSVKAELSLQLPAKDLLGLYRMVEHTLAHSPRVLQLASAYEREGAGRIAFELAIVAATQIGSRVLFLDMSPTPEGICQKLANIVPIPLGVLLETGGPVNTALVSLSGTGLVYTSLYGKGFSAGSLLGNLDSFDRFLSAVKDSYDIILLASPAMLGDVMAGSLARLVDGTILVIEANRTRAPVVLQTQQFIQANGGKAIGAILNKRRFYMPRWLYRML